MTLVSENWPLLRMICLIRVAKPILHFQLLMIGSVLATDAPNRQRLII